MKALVLAAHALLLVACASKSTAGARDAASPERMGADSGVACFPCVGYWICGADVGRIDLSPEVDGCYLSGLPGRNLLGADGTITADGVVVGKAIGSGARVRVSYPDGRQWLFCAGAGGCQ
jgi:hypothetical protein